MAMSFTLFGQEEKEMKFLNNKVYYQISSSQAGIKTMNTSSNSGLSGGLLDMDEGLLHEFGYERIIAPFTSVSISYQFCNYDISDAIKGNLSRVDVPDLEVNYQFDKYQFDAIMLDFLFFLEIKNGVVIYMKMGVGSASFQVGEYQKIERSSTVNRTTTQYKSNQVHNAMYRIGLGGTVGLYKNLGLALEVSYGGANFKGVDTQTVVTDDNTGIDTSESYSRQTVIYRATNFSAGLNYNF